MRLYQNSSAGFIEDVRFNRLSSHLTRSFVSYFGYSPSPAEVSSWSNSLQFLKNIIEINSLEDTALALEYQLPYSSQRIDCLLFGRDLSDSPEVVVIELKQWSRVEPCNVQGNVYTFIGGGMRMLPHPSIQVRGYHNFLKDFVTLFDDDRVKLSSCAYCHNYRKSPHDPLFEEAYSELIAEFPVFTSEDVIELGNYLKEKLGMGEGLELLNRFSTSPIGPSKKLMELTSKIINEKKEAFNLLDDQIVASNTILDRAKKASKARTKTVIVVRGGPGTGKSVIALNIMAELLKSGIKVFHATGSKTFTSTVRKIVGSRASNLFRYFNQFQEKVLEENDIDILVCDEAHRIRKTSNFRYTPRNKRSEIPQIDELIRVAKVSVFFIDDKQNVKPDEIGSSDLILNTADQFGAETFEFELKTQFRCNGSNGYLDWVNNVLEIGNPSKKKVLTEGDNFDFQIFDDPQSLREAIMNKNRAKPNSARLVAGFCWPWSSKLNEDGTLVKDVKIGSFEMPWEARDNYKNGVKLAPDIPLWYMWPYDPNGVNQIGCIYTVQGFEFDYIGVIFGEDLKYDQSLKRWVADKSKSFDPNLNKSSLSEDEFMDYAKNVYRVLLTRGMKGCFVYFVDCNTKQLFIERTQTSIDVKHS
ncbi:DNA/RNA helicase domain-containing protein [Mesotoga sp.]|uniref:DNA/RNA helicase domain-containing protein n=1 Tax=Mesotoga sp. TaxID=2053577 RepID=UPI00345EF6F3